MNTGKERSLTIKVEKRIGGILQPGYPVTYQGRENFWSGEYWWPIISSYELTLMSTTDFNARLASFISYVESIESGLVIAESIIDGGDAYRDNLTACPIS
jgi:hypothetical protein